MRSFALSGLLAVAWVLAVTLILGGGCRRSGATVLGAAPTAPALTLAAARTAAAGRFVTVQGRMIEKCPVAGCWFVLSDPTGQLRVDTKTAGFVVVDVPLQSRLTVSGWIRTTDGETNLEANGLRY